MPLVPPGASGRRASTRWRMFSVRSCSPAEMKILVPVMRIAAVGLRLGLGAQQAQIGAALGLGQAHRARPGAVGELGQVLLLELVGAVARQRLVGAVAEARIHREGLVRRGEHLLQREAHGGRQSLAAELRIAGDGGPAALGGTVVGVLEALGRAHDAVLVGAALLVAGAVEREQHVLAELGRFLDDGVDRVGRRVLVARQLGAASRRRCTSFSTNWMSFSGAL